MESDNNIISHMTSHIMDLTQLRSFPIITYLKVDISLILRYLIYPIFLVNLHNKPFESIFAINLFNQFISNWQGHWLVIRCFLKRVYVQRYIPIY